MSRFFRFCKDIKEIITNADKRNVLLLRMKQQPNITVRKSLFYGFFTYTGLSLYYCYNHNEHTSLYMSFSRKISAFAGFCASLTVPVSLRNTLYGQWVKTYNVIEDDMVLPLEEYNNFQEFFTRRVKEREIPEDKNLLIAPADSKILQIAEVKGDENILVKNINYSLGEFLTGINGYKMDGEVFDSLKKSEDKKSKIYQVIFYLNPGDYHRYHSPADMLVKRSWHILGYLAPVKESYIGKTPKVYETNERVALVGEYDQGFMSNVYVGATNVGSMTLTFDERVKCNQSLDWNYQKSQIREYNKQDTEKDQHQISTPYIQQERGIHVPKGAECGKFQLGSTVVMFFEVKDDVKFLVEKNQKIRFGQPFAQIIPKQQEQKQ